MSGSGAPRGWTVTRAAGPVVLVTRVGGATGSEAAAAALACAASEPDRAALLIDLDEGRAPRPSLIATAGARALEARLAAHLPGATIASRGSLCRLKLPADPEGIDGIVAALPLVRESAAVVHLPPPSLRLLIEEPRIRSTAALLRADLAQDRALTALAVRDLMREGLEVGVCKQAPGWLMTRAALLGALPGITEALSSRMCDRLLNAEDKRFRQCYDQTNGAEGDSEETSRQERRIRS